MVDSDRGEAGVAWRVGYISRNDSSDLNGGVLSVVCDCDCGNGEGGGEDADSGGTCFRVDGGSGGAGWA